MIDTYKTIAASSMGEFKDKGSKFIAYTTPLLPHSVRSDNLKGDFSLFLEKIKKEHPKARHHCYAWRMGIEASYTGNQYIYNDKKVANFWFVAAMVERKFKQGSLVLNCENLLDERQSKFETLVEGTISNPIFKPIWGPLEGRVINLSLKLNL